MDNITSKIKSIAILLTEAALLLAENGSHLSVYNDPGYQIPDEKDDPTRDERRAEGAIKLAKYYKSQKLINDKDNEENK